MFLDKTWFGPVGKQLEDRDAYLRDKLSAVKDDSGELNRLQVRCQFAFDVPTQGGDGSLGLECSVCRAARAAAAAATERLH